MSKLKELANEKWEYVPVSSTKVFGYAIPGVSGDVGVIRSDTDEAIGGSITLAVLPNGGTSQSPSVRTRAMMKAPDMVCRLILSNKVLERFVGCDTDEEEAKKCIASNKRVLRGIEGEPSHFGIRVLHDPNPPLTEELRAVLNVLHARQLSGSSLNAYNKALYALKKVENRASKLFGPYDTHAEASEAMAKYCTPTPYRRVEVIPVFEFDEFDKFPL